MNLWVHNGIERGREYGLDNEYLPASNYIGYYATKINSQYAGWSLMSSREQRSANLEFAKGFKDGFKQSREQIGNTIRKLQRGVSGFINLQNGRLVIKT